MQVGLWIYKAKEGDYLRKRNKIPCDDVFAYQVSLCGGEVVEGFLSQDFDVHIA